MSDSDLELLARYARHRAEDAFAEVVRRHVDLVYSAARRQVRAPELAEEVAQAVFADLARQAHQLPPETVLAAWLYQVTRRTAIDVVRREASRRLRERVAHELHAMNATAEDWTHIEPLLDDAMQALDETDRAAVLLRYFENKPLREVGQALGTSDDAAQKRVSRAVERLREFFAKRGVSVGVSGLVALVSAQAVQAAPAGFSSAVTAAALVETFTSSAGTLAAAKASVLTKWQLAVLAVTFAGVITVPLLRWLPAKESAPAASTTNPRPGITDPTVAANTVSPTNAAAVSSMEVNSATMARTEPLAGTALFTLHTPPGAVAIQADGKILAATLGGWFVDEASGTLGWYSRGAMRFEPDGTLDRSFFCDVGRPGSVNPMIANLSVARDGRVFVSGSFGSVDGQPRPGYALLRPDGRLDDSFVPWRGWTNLPGPTFMPGGTYSAALLEDGSVAIMSGSVEGKRAPHPLTAYRLDPTGRWTQPALTHSPPADWGYPPGLIQTLGWGGFWARRAVDWTREVELPRNYWHPRGSERPPVTDIAFELWTGTPTALQAAEVFRSLFEEVPMELCRYAVRLPYGEILLPVREGGIRGRFMVFDEAWRPRPGFTNDYEAATTSCMKLKRLKDGKLLVAGLVGKMNGEAFSGVVRLESDGAIDHDFRCGTSHDEFGRVLDFAVQEDGRIVICGYFTSVNGVACQHLARLNPDGSLDPSFRLPFRPLEEVQRQRFLRIARLAKKKDAALPTATANNTTAQADATAAAANERTADGPPETVMILSLAKENGGMAIQFTGLPAQLFILQAHESMSRSEWTNVSTNRTAASGVGVLRDPDSENYPTRFYRIARP